MADNEGSDAATVATTRTLHHGDDGDMDADGTPGRANRPDVDGEDPISERIARLSVTGLPRLSDRMTGLRSLIDEEYERLRAEWEALLAERDAINRIKDRIQAVNVGDNDRLKLNVSGQRFEISAKCAIKNKLFRNLMSNTFAQADADQFYYMDRDPKFVMVILNFMRDGDVDLEEYSDRQLRHIRSDAEYYMVAELADIIDRVLVSRRSGHGIVGVPLNRGVPTTLSFNGVFMELTVLKRNLALHSISFVAGDTRRIVAEAFLVEAPMDAGPSAPKPDKIGEVEIDAKKGDIITISFSAIALTANTYTIGVYSASCPTAIVACPTSMGSRDLSKYGLHVEHTYHTTNARGHWSRRAGQDEFDLVGELQLSS